MGSLQAAAFHVADTGSVSPVAFHGKRPHRIPAKEPGLVWEVDEYFGANAPLVTAEIELPDEKTVVELPGWIDHEVTDDHRYKNNNLAEHPFSEWYERKETK